MLYMECINWTPDVPIRNIPTCAIERNLQRPVVNILSGQTRICSSKSEVGRPICFFSIIIANKDEYLTKRCWRSKLIAEMWTDLKLFLDLSEFLHFLS